MFLRLLFILTLIPFLEIYFLVRLSDEIGWQNTLLIIFSTGLIGAWLLKKQGHSILMEIQKNASQHQLPSDALAKGFFTFVGGLLLLTPGILTDAIGLSLIFPPTQFFWKKFFKGKWQQGVSRGSVRFYSGFPPRGGATEESNPFERQQRVKRPTQFDSTVIDIKASQSKTVEKKEE